MDDVEPTGLGGLMQWLALTQYRPAGRSSISFPCFYASSLLQRVEHPKAQAALATIRVSPIAPYLSMMDFVDLARRAASTANPISIRKLESIVRDGLEDVTSGRSWETDGTHA